MIFDTNKLVHYLNIISDEFWKMIRLQFPTTKAYLLFLLAIVSMGLIAIASNIIRNFLLQYSQIPTPDYDELERGITDSSSRMN
jgi:hypothetical protein